MFEERSGEKKVGLLSELFVKWATSPEGEAQILELIQQVLDELQNASGNPSYGYKEIPSLHTAKGGAPYALDRGRDGSSSSHPSDTSRLNHPEDRLESPAVSSHQDPTGFSRAAASLDEIPSFYSRNLSQGILSSPNEEEITLLHQILGNDNNNQITKENFSSISNLVFKTPLWMKDLLFDRIVERTRGKSPSDHLTVTQVSDFFKNSCSNLTQTRRLFEIIKGDVERNYIILDDLLCMVKYLVAVHAGLQFLEQPEFQDYYSRTVAIRIMYALEHQQAKKIFWQDFNRSSLPDVVHQLDSKDVNDVLEYFSYEHFYVLYCKFWELDTDRDLRINYFDLCNYGQGMLTPLVVKRVVSGFGRGLSSGNACRYLDYEDFIYFCLSEEDKNSQAAVYYWFKVLDLDEDGVLCGYELNHFFAENQQRLAEHFDTDKPPSYEDMMCQMLDMLGVDPERLKNNHGGLTLADFRACPTPANFFNMIFNASKFMLFESKDPFNEFNQMRAPEKTAWDRFARAEYDRMADESQ